MHANPFSSEETARRLEQVRIELAGRKLDAAVFASPENVFYLTGLDHWGYFAPHLLMRLVKSAEEQVSMRRAAVLLTDKGPEVLTMLRSGPIVA